MRSPALSWSVVRSTVSISIVTGLIWLFAEAQSVSEQVVDVRVAFQAPQGSNLVVSIVDGGWTGTASVRIQGARAAIDNATHRLAGGVALMVGSAGVSATTGRQSVDLRSALSQTASLERAGVTIAAVEPRNTEILVDELVTLDGVTVRPFLPGVQTTGDVVVEPAQATIILPALMRDALAQKGARSVVTAELDPSTIGSLLEGVAQRREVRLTLPPELSGASNVRIEPATATLIFTVRSTTGTFIVPSVPVWPMVPPTDFNGWKLTIDPMLLHNVSLIGPSDVLDRIRAGEIRVIATVQLSSDDLEQRIPSKTPVFLGLPANVRVQSSIDPVKLSIVRRDKEPSSAPPQE